jgi:hypothetical protein
MRILVPQVRTMVERIHEKVDDFTVKFSARPTFVVLSPAHQAALIRELTPLMRLGSPPSNVGFSGINHFEDMEVKVSPAAIAPKVY